MSKYTVEIEDVLTRLGREAESSRPGLEARGSMLSALAIADALTGLTVAVEDHANRTVQRMTSLTTAIEAVNAVMEGSSEESGKLSRKLNSLTVWIAIAAIASAAATIAQVVIAVWSR